LIRVNPNFSAFNNEDALDIHVCEEAELDEPWSYVGNQSNQRWLW